MCTYRNSFSVNAIINSNRICIRLKRAKSSVNQILLISVVKDYYTLLIFNCAVQVVVRYRSALCLYIYFPTCKSFLNVFISLSRQQNFYFSGSRYLLIVTPTLQSTIDIVNAEACNAIEKQKAYVYSDSFYLMTI